MAAIFCNVIIMANGFSRNFANLAPAQLELAQRREAALRQGGDPLSSALQGLTQGVALQRLPQTIQQDSLNKQLELAIQQAKLNELSQGKVIEVGGRLVRVNPGTGNVDVLLDAIQNSNKQFVGLSGGMPIWADPRTASLTVGNIPAGIDLTGGLAPRVTPTETFSTVISDQGIMKTGNRSTTALPLTVGGQTVQSPQKPVNVRQFTDAQGNLFEQPMTGGVPTPVINPLTNTQMNTGVANQIISTDQGIFTAPKKTEGGEAPSTTPLIAPSSGVSPGTPLTRTTASKAAASNEAAMAMASDAADTGITVIDDLLTRVGPTTVGFAALTKGVPTSPALDFASDLDQLKSVVLIGTLQEMKNASKTGASGLGQVSNREGKILEAAKGSLEQAQSQENIKKNLNKIKESLQRWQEAKQKYAAKNPSDAASSGVSPLERLRQKHGR